MSIENALWEALEAGLGREKAAELQSQPLHKLARQRVMNDHGIDVGPEFTLGDAVGSLAISWRKKTANNRSIMQGLDSLAALTAGPQEKTASLGTSDLYPRDATFFTKLATAKKIRLLMPQLAAPEREVLAALRTQVDREVVMSVTKLAAGVLQGISENPIARNLGKGALFGMGAAVPTAVVGNHLIGNAQQSADESSARAIDHAHVKAVDTAKILAMLGVGTYGAGSAINHAMNSKQASYGSDVYTVNTDLAASLYVTELLDASEKTASVLEVQTLNDEFLVDLLSED